MPFLDLSVDDVGPNRTREALARIEAVMLFPDDREKASRVAYYGAGRAAIEPLPADADITTPAAFMRWLANAPDNLNSLSSKIERRFIIGLAIGRVVTELLCNRDKSLGSALDDAAARFNKIRESHPSLNRLRQNYWENARFRSVCHLWAATYTLQVWTPRQVFPCALID
jgi:hypothetical protein